MVKAMVTAMVEAMVTAMVEAMVEERRPRGPLPPGGRTYESVPG